MAEIPKILGQLAPAGQSLQSAYVVPANRNAVVSSILVCNRGGTHTTFRISLSVAGAADTTAQYIYYDEVIYANQNFTATVGVGLEAADIVRVYAGNANLSFNVLGEELT